jgi:cellulose synthase/poly-beta-1,6-N-acetylglucosamine synthase-like glycosyltransferase
MCNGANLCYRKSAFYEAGGFKGIDAIASGDDMLLMHKMRQKYPDRIGYLFSEEVIVKSLPMPGWKSFINQRIRWASKADSYEDKRIFRVLFLVYLLNLLLFILPFIAFWYPTVLCYWLVLIALKTLAELPFMISVASFFHYKKLLWWFPVMQPFHIIYMVVAGCLGKFGKYQWKGRQVR